ncbi:MAG: FAD-dependent oxidoreductase [Candidatus Schekmanbacteria bacterium]|nr:FAD-dependent oxidoreductase [Candidatus Schekmanbacteria bacterium]
MESAPVILKTINNFRQAPERFNSLLEKGTIKDLKAVWSKEGLVLNDPATCIVEMVYHLLRYARQENCGKCTPCREGTRRMFEVLERIKQGSGKIQDLVNLRAMATAAAYGSDCSFGEIVGFTVLDSLSFTHPYYQLDPEIKRDPYLGKWLKNAEYIAHIRGKSNCPQAQHFTAHFTPCQLRCPLGTDIAYFLSAIAMNKNTEAKEHVLDVNYLPRTLGKVCGLCKQDCTLHKAQTGAIDINGLKDFACCKAVLYKEFENVHLDRASYLFNFPLHRLKKTEYQQKIAIVGGGPAGIAATIILGRLGYQVTLLERDDRLGGLARYAIPRDRLPDELLDNDLKELFTDKNVEVRFHTSLGKDVQIQELLDNYDAVLLTAGAQKPLAADLPGETTCPQVLNFLQVMKDYNLKRYHPIGKRAAIIGAGNSAMDVATASSRVGYEATVYYRRTRDKMRADPHEIEIALHAGVNFEFEMVPLELVVENGKLKGIMFDLKGEKVFREADILIPAIGQVPNYDLLFPEGFRLETDKSGCLVINPKTGKTSHPRIFAAGDIVIGKTVANSLQEGAAAALNIHKDLNPQDSLPENPWVHSQANGHLGLVRKIASALYGIGDPYSEELRERWNNSIKAKLRKTGHSELQAAHNESNACQRCRFLITMAY